MRRPLAAPFRYPSSLRGLGAAIVATWCLVQPAAATETGIASGDFAELPDGFVLQQVGWGPFVDGRPTGFALLPDGRVIMVERQTGAVRLNAVGVSSSVVIHTIPDVNFVGGEQGLLGVCVDPDWPTRPYLYFHYNHTGGTVYVSMFEAQGDLTDPSSTSMTLANPYHLLTDCLDDTALHQAGTVRFGPDGMLYVSLGDDGNSCNSQDLSLLAGKILRLDVSAMPGAGSGPPAKSAITPADNPFSGPGDNERLTWVWGLRNPFRFTVDPQTGDLYIGDVGEIQYEEVDHVPYASGGGENFGWPLREGPVDPGTGFTCGLGNPFTDPILSYPRTVGITVIGAPIYRHPTSGPALFQYPALYDGSYFLVDFYGGWWRRYVQGVGGWEPAPPVPGQPTSQNWAQGLHYCSDIQLGPDGAIYYARLIPVVQQPGVYRIIPSSPVSAPPAAAVPSLVVAPNPARSAQPTGLTWTTPRRGESRLSIYDAGGRLVRTLSARADAGPVRTEWNATDARGRRVPAGVYFVVLETPGGERSTRKISRLR